MKRISFIITYHDEPLLLLQECVQRVLSLPLSAEEREILLIDDGSSHPAPAFKSITLVRQENQGLSVARNKGLEMAQGEYVQFLDADDFLLSEAYGHVLEQQARLQPDVLLFGFTHQHPRGKAPVPKVELFRSGTDFLLTRNMRSSACCYLFRRSILGDLRFLPGILHEDELFTPQLLLRAGRFAVSSAIPYYYRVRSTTITHQQAATHISRRMEDTLFVIRELDSLAQKTCGKEREALCRRVCQLTMDHILICLRLTHSFRAVRSCLCRLREDGFYPLPLRFYTLWYWLGSLMLDSLCFFL